MAGLIGALFAAYPLIVWVGLECNSPRHVAVGLLCVLAPASWVLLRRARFAGAGLLLMLAPLLTLVAIASSVFSGQAAWLFAEPVVISMVMLGVFGITLRGGAMPMIERFARMQEPDLSVDKQRWCRLWTWIWCGFFLFHSATAWVLAVAAPMKWWVAYTTTISYAVMGALFAIEWTLRKQRFGGA